MKTFIHNGKKYTTTAKQWRRPCFMPSLKAMKSIPHFLRHFLEIFLDTFGYRDTQDLLNHTIPCTGMKYITIYSLVLAAIARIFGIPAELFFGLVFGVILELVTGTTVSLYYRKEKWSSKKFGRFFFKVAILLFLLACINLMKIGFAELVEVNRYYYVDSVVMFSLDSLFLFFLLAMAWYVILSVVENMAQTQMPFFVTLAKFLRVKIHKIEEFTG